MNFILVLLEDDRIDSPGLCAHHCTYTMMENDTKKMVGMQTLDKTLGEKWSFPKKETQGKPRGIVTAVVSLWFPFYGNTHVVSTWFPQQETVNMWFPSSFHKQETCRKPPRGFHRVSKMGNYQLVVSLQFPQIGNMQETTQRFPKWETINLWFPSSFQKNRKHTGNYLKVSIIGDYQLVVSINLKNIIFLFSGRLQSGKPKIAKML